MTNIYYNASGNPATGSDGLSSLMRAEFAAIAVAFDLMPQISTTGAFSTVFAQQGNFTFTLPPASGTLARMSDLAAETTRAETAEALLAPKASPVLSSPTFTIGATLSYTLPTLDNSTQAVSSAWVANFLAASGFAPAGASPVTQVAGRTGNVILVHGDITDWAAAVAAATAAPTPGFLYGLVLSNDVSITNAVIDIAAGSCADSANAVKIVLGAFTKNISGAWVAGSGGNGMGTGLTATASTWYHVYAATIGGAADVFFDTTFPPTHAPASTTASRRIGSFKVGGSGNIVPFVQNGDRVDAASGTTEFTGIPGHTTADVLTLSSVPSGVSVQALLTGTISDSSVSNSGVYLSALFQTDSPASIPNVTGVNGPAGGTFSQFNAVVMTNTSAQIRRRVGSATVAMTIMCSGYIDTRGRI